MWIIDLTFLSSGFQSTNRANPLAQKIVAADIALGLDDTFTFYSADNCNIYLPDDTFKLSDTLL